MKTPIKSCPFCGKPTQVNYSIKKKNSKNLTYYEIYIDNTSYAIIAKTSGFDLDFNEILNKWHQKNRYGGLE